MSYTLDYLPILNKTTIDGHTGDLLTVDEYQAYCDDSVLRDCIGWGHSIKDGQIIGVVVPSYCPRDIQGATHVLWYNK